MKRRKEYIVDCSSQNPEMPKLKQSNIESVKKNLSNTPQKGMSAKEAGNLAGCIFFIFLFLMVVFGYLGHYAMMANHNTLKWVFYGIAFFWSLCIVWLPILGLLELVKQSGLRD